MPHRMKAFRRKIFDADGEYLGNAIGKAAMSLLTVLNRYIPWKQKELNKDIWVTASYQDFARKTGLTTETVKSSLQVLENLGLIISRDTENDEKRLYTTDPENFMLLFSVWTTYECPHIDSSSVFVQKRHETFLTDYQQHIARPNETDVHKTSELGKSLEISLKNVLNGIRILPKMKMDGKKINLDFAIGLEGAMLFSYINDVMNEPRIALDETTEKEMKGQIWLRRTYHDFTEKVGFAMTIRDVAQSLQFLEKLGIVITAEAESKNSKWYCLDKDNFRFFLEQWEGHQFPNIRSPRPLDQRDYNKFLAHYELRRDAKASRNQRGILR
jgi:DNA-binding MarR family transcriptional regulator